MNEQQSRDPLEGWWREGDDPALKLPRQEPTEKVVLTQLENTLETLSEEVAEAQKLVAELSQAADDDELDRGTTGIPPKGFVTRTGEEG